MQITDNWTKSLMPDFTDYVIILVYLLIMFFVATNIKNRHIDTNPVYRFYVWGLFASVFGALAMGLIYTLYYQEGGDTIGYYRSSEALVNLLFRDPGAYIKILLGDESREAYSAFSKETGYPWYWGKSSSFFVVRVTSIFTLLGFKNYFTASILFAWFFYGGSWKLFLLATQLYPRYSNSLAFGILFFPSVLFWGSGISKDTITLAATGWFVYSVYMATVEKRNIIKNLIVVALAIYLIIYVKPYVFVAIIPAFFIFLAWRSIKTIENPILRITLLPLSLFAFLAASFGLLNLFSELLGDYGTLESIIRKAIITYEDHIRAEQYGYNFYSLGEFDGTMWDFFSKAPAAIAAGLFRPYMWEIRNPVMFLAAAENTAFMILVLVILWKTGPIKMIKIIFDEPLVVFSLTFAIVFAFAVGISTANFGALVRLKIPLLPFITTGLFILYHKAREIKKISTESSLNLPLQL
jgi:hypothetical protein